MLSTRRRSGRAGLQALLAVFGTVALVAGVAGVLAGAAGVRHGGPVSANVDSEFRYFAAWYAAAGVLALRAVPRVQTETATIRAVCAGLLLGAAGRVVSMARLGRPDDLFVVLAAVELAVAVVVLVWQARVSRVR